MRTRSKTRAEVQKNQQQTPSLPKPKRSKLSVPKPQLESQPQIIAIKPPKKPRKYVHNQYQASRIARGKNQRMFLLSVSREADFMRSDEYYWMAKVLGHSGNTYNVIISTKLSCSCPDFFRQRKPCKHIYFMISQVAQFDQFFDKMKNTLTLSKVKFQQLDSALKQRLAPRIKPKEDKKQAEEQKPGVDLGEQTDCAICFQELQKNGELFLCEQCKKHFHCQCIIAWKSKNTTCPLCRHDLGASLMKAKRDSEGADLIELDDLQENHPLKRLKVVNLSGVY